MKLNFVRKFTPARFVPTIAMGIIMGVVLAGLSCLTPAAACAGFADGPRNYGVIKIGGFQPTNELDDAGYDDNFDIGFSYGRYLAENLVLEGTLEIFGSEQDVVGTTRTTGTYFREDVLAVSSLLVTLKGEFPVGAARFFAGGGLGGYLVGFESEVTAWGYGTFDVDDEDVVFGAHVTAGVNVDVGPRWFIGLEGLYRWTDDVEVMTSFATIPVGYTGNLEGYAITVGGGFRF